MSKMNELSIEQQEASYELFIEAQRDELRREGAEEMRIEIVRELDVQIRKAWTKDAKLALEAAKIIVERATV